jgi:hypothetical protein
VQMQSFIVGAIVAVTLVVAPTSPAAAPAHADCGDPGQPACAGPVPSPDQVVAVLAELTDPGRPAASKSDVVTPGFSPEEAQNIDDHMRKLSARGVLPLNFVVADIQPAPANFAGVLVGAEGSYHQTTPLGPAVMVNQGGRWLMTHDTALTAVNAFWANANRPHNAFVPHAV